MKTRNLRAWGILCCYFRCYSAKKLLRKIVKIQLLIEIRTAIFYLIKQRNRQ